MVHDRKQQLEDLEALQVKAKEYIDLQKENERLQAIIRECDQIVSDGVICASEKYSGHFIELPPSGISYYVEQVVKLKELFSQALKEQEEGE